MKLLSIGNSFSQDAHKWLHKLATVNGVDLQTVNLYYPGCSLEQHWAFYQQDEPAYQLERNGGKGDRMIGLREALAMDRFDAVTLQQVSGLSGLPQSYEPYLTDLAALVRAEQPQAALWVHQTWAYEVDFERSSFENYQRDQQRMYRDIKAAVVPAAERIGAQIIPAGDLIQRLREQVPEFDYPNGGRSLNRDGFHLSLDYGRYAVAAMWLYALTGTRAEPTPFEDFDSALLKKILAELDE